MATISIPGMFLTGNHAGRPAASGVGKGTLYACSTHALIYQTTDGSTWTTWATLDASGGIPATIFDTKGDLIAASAADTAAKLAVIAGNGSSLVVASGETTGLKWQLNKYDATTAPTVNEDSGDGYSVGSIWIDVTGDDAYICVDASSGAAVWLPFDAGGGSESWEGTWSAGSYITGDIVEHNDVIYQANTGTSNEPPDADWDILYTAPSGATEPPYNYANVLGGAYGQHGGNDYYGNGTLFSANNATNPQDAVFDLQQPRTISRVRVRYGASNYSGTGQLDYWDGAAWQTVASWTGITTLDRTHTFSAQSAQLWRIYTSAGGGINFSSIQFFNGSYIDHALGITPTSDQSFSNIGNATDGIPTSIAAGLSATNPQYIQVDLGAAHDVEAIYLGFHAGAAMPSNTTTRGTIQHSANGSAWTTVFDYRSSSRWWMNRLFVLPAPVNDRYWRVNTTTGGGINYVAFEVLGT